MKYEKVTKFNSQAVMLIVHKTEFEAARLRISHWNKQNHVIRKITVYFI